MVLCILSTTTAPLPLPASTSAAGDTHVIPIDLTLPGGRNAGSISLRATKTLEEVTNPPRLVSTLTGAIEYSGCLGIDGVLDAWARSEVYSEDHEWIQVRLNGTLYAEGCAIDYTDIYVSLAGDPDDLVERYVADPYISSGTMLADCEGERVLRTLNDVYMSDQQALENSCTLQ